MDVGRIDPRSRRSAAVVAVLVHALLVAAILATFRDYGISWDEDSYVASGMAFLRTRGRAAPLARELQEHFRGGGVDFWRVHMATHGIWMDGAIALPLRLLYGPAVDGGFRHAGSHDALHLTKALVFSLAVPLVWASARATFRSASAPILAMLFLVLEPRWYGDIFDNHMDGAATLLYAAGLFAGVRLLHAGTRRATVAWLVAFASLAALGFAHRTHLLSLPLALLPAAVLRTRRGLAAGTALGAAVFAGVLLLADPYLRLQGPSALREKVTVAATIPGGRAVLFEGRVVTEPLRRYIPEMVAITTPLATLAFLALGVAHLVKRIARRRGADATAVFLLGTLVVPVAVVVAVNPTLCDGWRHVLFLSVPLALVAAAGWDRVAVSVRRGVFPAAVAVAAAGLAVTLVAMIRLHPYQYTYFNALVGGLGGASARYETDYWAKSYREAALWIGSQVPEGARVLVHACGPHWAVREPLRGRARMVGDPARADYQVCFRRGLMQPPPFAGKVVHEVTRDGAVLSWVMRRGTPPG